MKSCPECGNVILGRMDKKFCSDMCRNNFNNKLNADNNNYVRNINNSLKKNRRILEDLCPDEKGKTTRNTLNDRGFDFNYITHQRKTQKGTVYFFVYDYGYLELENDFFLIVKDNRIKESA
jgi:DNA-directed RNA polymerase subunit M/transcription elongation factor TFIIS